MRNLKKILALVLALVMSLSLMATASAADTTAASPALYKTATDVLVGLTVVKGDLEDPTNYRTNEPIIRAEAAALIYRVHTGDMNDTLAGVHDNTPFTDLGPVSTWATGYISYAQNAKIVKGKTNTTFDPLANITGYETLAMTLRAMGYGQNGEFEGDEWRIKTSSWAQRIGLFAGISAADQARMDEPATRGLVFQIMFNAMLLEEVGINYTTTDLYAPKGTTLGQRNFGLEKVTGVVMANEWANLNEDGDTVLDAGHTEMKVTKVQELGATVKVDDVIDLNHVTEDDAAAALDGVGQTYNAYIANGSSSTSKTTLTLEKSDINDVKFNEGAAKNVGSLAGSLKLDDDTEYYVNYANEWYDDATAEMRIAYAISQPFVDGLADTTWKDYMDRLEATNNGVQDVVPDGTMFKDYYPIGGHYISTRTIKVSFDVDGNGTIGDGTPGATENLTCYFVAIRPGYTINEIDQAMMQEIFYSADRLGSNGVDVGGVTVAEVRNYALGEVYAGTTSMKDWSDEISWREYREKFFTVDTNSRKFNGCVNGESLRIIDNNGDGTAEYVLKIVYTQDKIVGTYKSEALCNTVAMADYEGNLLYNPDSVSAADQRTIVNYTEIDSKLYIWKADVVTGTVTTKNWKDTTVTVNGETYGQSGIDNETKLPGLIMLMDDDTEYNIYLDEFGYIRSYELAQEHKYALLTEMYPTGSQQSNYVNNYQSMVEMKVGDGEIEEHLVNNTTPTNPGTFYSPYVWSFGRYGFENVSGVVTNGVVSNAYNTTPNYLQPAVAHLGAQYKGDATYVDEYYALGATDSAAKYVISGWSNRWATGVKSDGTTPAGSPNLTGVFDYGPGYGWSAGQNVSTDPATQKDDHSYSLTNVAIYTQSENGNVTLKTAAELATSNENVNGDQLFRVSNGAAAAAAGGIVATATDADKATIGLWGHGTEDQLVKAYMRAHGEITETNGQNWFDTWTNASNKTGNGIYPIYAEDYVQLDLTKDASDLVGQTSLDPEDVVVEAGTRHYRINDNYQSFYNTNSNRYVDATIDTEFYIVMPNSIMYKVGYAELPNIKVEEIRAAYAVAQNVNADNDEQDYWVADVIVIETQKLDYDYQSISLAYYNPSETSNSVRYVNTLNNQWKALQPTYDGKAQMAIVPSRVNWNSNTNTTWGNTPWNNGSYGFYKLYNTELAAEGELNVGSITQITADYNEYGIYAGKITRKNHLETSGYLDVDTVNTGSGYTELIDVNYGETNQVPFYRIYQADSTPTNRFSLQELTLNSVESKSDVKIGDQIIWVYNLTKNELAFVVDVTVKVDSNGDGSVNARDNQCAAWLVTEYGNIITDQTPAVEKVSVDLGLGAGENGHVTYGNTNYDDTNDIDQGNNLIDFNVPKGIGSVSFTVTLDAPATLGAAFAVTGRWTVLPAEPTADPQTWTIKLVDASQIKSLTADIPTAGNVALWTETKTVDFLNDAATDIAAWDTLTDDEKSALRATLNKINNGAVAGADLVTDGGETVAELLTAAGGAAAVEEAAADMADSKAAYDAAVADEGTTPEELKQLKADMYADAKAYADAGGATGTTPYTNIKAAAQAEVDALTTAATDGNKTNVAKWKEAAEALADFTDAAAELTETDVTDEKALATKMAAAYTAAKALVAAADAISGPATPEQKAAYNTAYANLETAIKAIDNAATMTGAKSYTGANTPANTDGTMTLDAAITLNDTLNPAPAEVSKLELKDPSNGTIVKSTENEDEWILTLAVGKAMTVAFADTEDGSAGKEYGSTLFTLLNVTASGAASTPTYPATAPTGTATEKSIQLTFAATASGGASKVITIIVKTTTDDDLLDKDAPDVEAALTAGKISATSANGLDETVMAAVKAAIVAKVNAVDGKSFTDVDADAITVTLPEGTDTTSTGVHNVDGCTVVVTIGKGTATKDVTAENVSLQILVSGTGAGE